jgi:voltage-gated potassium channel
MVAASMESFVKSQIESKDVMLSDLRGHLLVCGWDRAALLVLRSLQNQPRKWSKGVVIIAEVEEQLDKLFPNSVAGRLFHVRADYTRFEVLESCGAQYADSALIFADRAAQLRDQDRDARTVLAALTLEKLNPNIYTCAELMDEQNGAHLKIAGVEEVVSHAALTAQVMARAALERFQEEEQPSIPAEIPIQVADMIRSKGVLLSLEDSLVGSSLAAVASHYRDNQVGLVVGIIGEGQSMPIVDETYVICSGDRLLLVGV